MYLKRFETRGDSFWDQRNIEKENIETFCFSGGKFKF